MERKTSQFKHVEEHTTPEVEFSWLPSGTEWCVSVARVRATQNNLRIVLMGKRREFVTLTIARATSVTRRDEMRERCSEKIKKYERYEGAEVHLLLW